MLLVAERAALLSGRDDEFVALVTMGFTGVRWGELVGLEPQFVRPEAIRVEWQLYELDNGRFERCPPQDESRRSPGDQSRSGADRSEAGRCSTPRRGRDRHGLGGAQR